MGGVGVGEYFLVPVRILVFQSPQKSANVLSAQDPKQLLYLKPESQGRNSVCCWSTTVMRRDIENMYFNSLNMQREV